ncbi:glycosyltransferase family 2 protein [Flavobacteriaceae bacterium TK19130]|nr:glycosyltransferase family 2 protein [Thermobacterium salinum]
MKTALLVSTYNWPEALNLLFKSLLRQSELPDEFLIADDGSKPETTDLIEGFRKQTDMEIVHVWHEDEGFKRSEILNKTIAQSKAAYIIQTDGDCILHKHFIKDHKAFAKRGQYLFGSRVNILEEYRDELFETENISFNMFSKGIKNRTRTLHIPLLSNLYSPQTELSKKLRGCNVSFWRDDFIKVNGYNEAMTGWGREDSELIIRMINSGVKGRRLRYRGIIFHIWHPVSSKDNLDSNEAVQQKAIEEKLTRCEVGIEQYL